MQEKQNIFLPIAIIVAAILIAGAVIFTGGKNDKGIVKNDQPEKVENDPSKAREVSASDHIRGNINAKIKIIEYSDTECPFCKRYHEVLKNTYNELGANGEDIAIIYRQFPLTNLHQKAFTEALATECAASLGGNDVFWKYLDTIYEKTPSNDGLNLSDLPVFAKEVGLNVDEFNKCLSEKRFTDKINADAKEAVATGAQGTPWSVFILADGSRKIVNGYIPEEQFKGVIKNLLGKN